MNRSTGGGSGAGACYVRVKHREYGEHRDYGEKRAPLVGVEERRGAAGALGRNAGRQEALGSLLGSPQVPQLEPLHYGGHHHAQVFLACPSAGNAPLKPRTQDALLHASMCCFICIDCNSFRTGPPKPQHMQKGQNSADCSRSLSPCAFDSTRSRTWVTTVWGLQAVPGVRCQGVLRVTCAPRGAVRCCRLCHRLALLPAPPQQKAFKRHIHNMIPAFVHDITISRSSTAPSPHAPPQCSHRQERQELGHKVRWSFGRNKTLTRSQERRPWQSSRLKRLRRLRSEGADLAAGGGSRPLWRSTRSA